MEIPGADPFSSVAAGLLPCECAVAQGCGNVLVVDTGGDEGPGWDFFVSYSQADRAWAEWIAWELEAARHRVLVQPWDFVPGSNWIQGMQEGVTRAGRAIAVLSPAYLQSEFVAAEWQAAWGQDPAARERKLLVVRVAECDRPGLLSGVVSID